MELSKTKQMSNLIQDIKNDLGNIAFATGKSPKIRRFNIQRFKTPI